MKKLKNNAGFSLIEMLLAIAVLVLLIVGMQSGLDAGVHAYGESMFESNSAALAGILNSAIGDVLRYAEDIVDYDTVPEGAPAGADKVNFYFTNYEYGVRDAYLKLDTYDAGSENIIFKIAGWKEVYETSLVTTGAYPDLTVQPVDDRTPLVRFVPSDGDATNGPENYFNVKYKIVDMRDASRTKEVTATIRLMNPKD